MLICVLVGIAMGMYQQQAGVYDWNQKSYGLVRDAQVVRHQIHYKGVDNNGVIDRTTGNLVSRNEYVACSVDTYVAYDAKQYIVLLLNEGRSILAERQLNEPIEKCITMNDEYVLILKNTLLHVSEHVIQYDVQTEYVGKIDGHIVYFKLQDGEMCAYQLGDKKLYCFKVGDGIRTFKEFGDNIIYYDNLVALKLSKEQTVKLDHTMIVKTKQFLGYAGSIVVEQGGKRTLRDLNDQLIMDIGNGYLVENVAIKELYFIVDSRDGELHITQYHRDTKQSVNQKMTVNSRSRVIGAFLLDLNKKQLLVQLEDLHTILVNGDQVQWTSEQALRNIDAVYFEKYDNEETTHKNAYYESLELHGAQNPLYLIQNLVLRVSNEISDLIQFIIHQKQLWGNQQVKSTEIEINYALKQKVYMVAYSEYSHYDVAQQRTLQLKQSLLLCYDTHDQQLIFKVPINNLDASFKYVAHYLIDSNLMQKEGQQGATPVRVFFYYSEEKQKLHTYMFDSSNQFMQQVASQNSKNIVWTIPYRVEHGPGSHHNLVILIDEDMQVKTYPPLPTQLNTQQIILYRYTAGQLQGYQLVGTHLTQLWTIHMVDKLLSIRSSYHSESPRVAIWDDKKVLFKLIDHSNFAVLTSDADLLKLMIVNAKTGKIIFQSTQRDVDLEQPINMQFDEHQVFVTYYNKAQMIYEIWTVEIYHAKIEVSFIKMLEDYYFNPTDTYANYYKGELEALFLQQVYGYPLGVKTFSISRTLKSLTKKNLLITTQLGQVHSLDRNLVSARRREKADQQVLEFSLQSAELPPYQYLLPIIHQSILSYSLELNLRNSAIQPTNLESTSLLLMYGDDVFFTPISPDKTYDMLQPDFNYMALTATIVLVLVGMQVLKRMSKVSKQIKQFYRN